MKYLLIFLCFTFVNGSAHLYAQNSGIIEYGIEYTGLMMDLSQLSEFQKTRQLQYSANAKRILKPDRSAFKVRFNEKGAVPELIPMMASDHGISMVDLILVSDEWIYLDGVKYHRNKNNGTIYFFVTSEQPEDFKYKLKSKFKTILGYKCQKAIVSFKRKLKDKTKSFSFTVWFTPEIPYGYAPGRFFGLPGLVLEFEREGRKIYARKISLKEDMKIDFPKEKFLLSRKERKEILGF